MTKVYVAADHAGVEMKLRILALLGEKGFEHEDLGAHDSKSVDYPDFAHAVSKKVIAEKDALGVLICGTGVGMSMSANKHPGVRAVVCSDTFSAKMSRAHNNANVLCLGTRVVGQGLAEEILLAFLEGKFEGGRHERRVQKIDKFES